MLAYSLEKKRQEHLESRSRPVDDDQPTACPVQYSFDCEDSFVHVDLSGDDLSGDGAEGCRVIFSKPCSSLSPSRTPSPCMRSLYHRTPPLSRPGSDDNDYLNTYGSTDIGDSTYGDGAPGSTKAVCAHTIVRAPQDHCARSRRPLCAHLKIIVRAREDHSARSSEDHGAYSVHLQSIVCVSDRRMCAIINSHIAPTF